MFELCKETYDFLVDESPYSQSVRFSRQVTTEEISNRGVYVSGQTPRLLSSKDTSFSTL